MKCDCASHISMSSSDLTPSSSSSSSCNSPSVVPLNVVAERVHASITTDASKEAQRQCLRQIYFPDDKLVVQYRSYPAEERRFPQLQRDITHHIAQQMKKYEMVRRLQTKLNKKREQKGKH